MSIYPARRGHGGRAVSARSNVIVNNAGYGLMGAVEELDALELEDVFKTNFFGAREVIRALLPTLRASPYLHALRADSDEVSAR